MIVDVFSLLNATVDDIVKNICIIAGILAVICYLIQLGYNYAVSSINSISDMEVKFFDTKDFIRTVVVLACIGLYPAIVDVTRGTINVFRNATSMNISYIDDKSTEISAKTYEMESLLYKIKKENNPDKLEPLIRAYAELAVEKNKGQGGDPGFLSYLKDIFDLVSNPTKLLQLSLGALFHIIASVIKCILEFFIQITLCILFCVGPFAFAFSILKVFQNQINIWAGAVLNLGFSLVTLNIIDGLGTMVTNEVMHPSPENRIIVESFSTSGTMLGVQLIVDCVLIISMLCCFWITSKYVGSADGGKVMGKAVGVAAAAFGGAAVGGAVGGAAGSSVASTGSRVADIGKNMIQDD